MKCYDCLYKPHCSYWDSKDFEPNERLCFSDKNEWVHLPDDKCTFDIIYCKKEAYKEFAERLKRSTVTAVIGNEIYAVATSKGVDNLLKEMVGEENDA